MFVVVDVRHRFLFWTSVVLEARAAMALAEERLGSDGLGAPNLETRRIEIQAGESFTINARRSDRHQIGDLVSLDRVANRLPISLKWRGVPAG